METKNDERISGKTIKSITMPRSCKECINDKTCRTYYASNVCQKKWNRIK